MQKLRFSALTWVAILIVINLVIDGIATAVQRYTHNETWAIALEVFIGIVGNGLMVYLQSEETVSLRLLANVSLALDKAFFVFMIVVVNASSQLISTILPIYVSNATMVLAIQLFISLVATGLIAFLSAEEPPQIKQDASTLWKVIIALLFTVLIFSLGILAYMWVITH